MVRDTGSGKLAITRVLVDKLEGSFTGTGDASAALLLAWSHMKRVGSAAASSSEIGTETGGALLNTLESIQAILRRTSRKQKKNMEMKSASSLPAEELKAYRSKATELCLIESRFDIMNPPREIDTSVAMSSWYEESE